MSYKKYAWVIVVLIAATFISSCTKSLYGNATPLPTTKPFTNPLPTEGMLQVGQFATQTALAKAAIPGGGATATPIAPAGVGTVIATNTPLVVSVIPTSTPLGGVAVPTNTSAPAPVIGRPATYTLQTGEFPYCIARRFNVNPDDLLALNGLGDGSLFMPGTTLKIPQSGSFPGDRALRSHPATYSVASSDETFYSIACLFGDVDPAQIAQANGLSLASILTIGQAIKIP